MVLKRLNYSNVVATLALFVALGGGAYAAVKLPANSVGSKQLKKNAVTGAKVKNGSLKGADIDVSTLGKVPAAASADSAASAASAQTAGSAQTAKSADKATTADSATSAHHADTATSANSAGSATNATNAQNATNAGHATNADNAALADDSNHLGGLLPSAFLPSADVQRINFDQTGCGSTPPSRCSADVVNMAAFTVHVDCSSVSNAPRLEVSVTAAPFTPAGNGNTNWSMVQGTSASSGGFGGTGTIFTDTTNNQSGTGTIVLQSVSDTISISYTAFASGSSLVRCEFAGTALRAE